MGSARPLPTGTVTFLFTDIEGSTQLLRALSHRYADVLSEQRTLLRRAFEVHEGIEVDTQGDALFFAFPTARDAVAAAVAGQRALAAHAWPDGATVRVRMGVHTGEALAKDTGYVGMDVHRAARISAAGHGGQVLLSETTHMLVEDDLPESIGLRYLGDYRLKDLARPQRLFQVIAADLPSEFPPVKSLDSVPNNLPLQLTSFVGRQREMADLKKLLETTRLLTLTGVGGTGKTRLALQVAGDVLDGYEDGVWIVELAPLADPELLPGAVASILKVRDVPGRPIMTTIVEYLQTKQTLLVLDNCEHVLSACAHVIDTVLHACPRVRVLATSREGLGIAGELTYAVPSLAVPDAGLPTSPDAVAQHDAIRLFVERAAFVTPSFALTAHNARAIVQVCTRLDGIPLALELAAARMKGMTAEQVAGRLDDRFKLLTGGSRTALPRHQTLRAAMDWSYDLLTGHERTLLRRLSVFSGGFTLDAAEVVCAHHDLAGQVLDLLMHLVNKSLVQTGTEDEEARYRQLETVRQYAQDKLLESGEIHAARRRHLEWFVHLAERAEPELRGPDQALWMRRLDADHNNFRAALEWSKAAEDGDAMVRIVAALWRFWNVRAHWREGLEWLETALSRGSDAPTAAGAKARLGAGALAWWQADFHRASAHLEQALALARARGDKRTEADALRILAQVAWWDDFARATALGEESLKLFKELADPMGISAAARFLGLDALNRGDFPRALPLLEESHAMATQLHDERGIAWSLQGLAVLARAQGDFAKTERILTETIPIFRKLGDKPGIAYCITTRSIMARSRGQYDEAVRLGEEALKILREIGSKDGVGHALVGLGLTADAQGALDQARALCEEGLALLKDVKDAAGIAGALHGLGLVARHRGDAAAARTLLEESLSIFEHGASFSSVIPFHESSVRWGTAEVLADLGRLAHHQREDDKATALHQKALALRWESGEQLGVALSLEGLAAVATARGDAGRGARLLGAATAIREKVGAPLPPVDRAEHERHSTELREQLGETEFAAALAEGRALTFEQAVTYARSGRTD